MSEIKVNKITPRVACGTTQLGDSGDTFTIPAGATINNLGTASGFGATGAVNWDVASIKTTDFTAVSGNGYFVDTATTGAVIVTLPAAPSVGDVVGVSDYAKNFSNANCTLNRNSLNIGGDAVNATLSTDGVAVTLVYVDVTKGWIVTDSGNQADAPTALFLAATGGCITTCGDYKVHTFLSPNTFVVTCAGNAGGSNTIDYMVVAGGGSSSQGGPCTLNGAGGGGGGYRESVPSPAAWTASPLASPGGGLTVTATPYAITVGGGGARVPGDNGQPGLIGNDSTFSTITSTGGGAGRNSYPSMGTCGTTTANGGSGGGGAARWGCASCTNVPGGNGDTPSTPIAQGTPGGMSTCNNNAGGGGGGATVAGGNSSAPPPTNIGGSGGAGATTEINFSPVTYSGGGGGGALFSSGPAGPGGGGIGGNVNGGPGPSTSGGAGGVNTGGGAGGGAAKSAPGSYTSYNAAGGSGIVVLRYKYQ